MSQAILLHTIEDVKHCLKHGMDKDAQLFSANAHVVNYLKYQCGIECQNICLSINAHEIISIQEITLQASVLLLKELDIRYAQDLNKQLGLSIRYFEPLYTLAGSRQLSVYVMLMCCFKNMFERNSISNVMIYDGVLGPLNSSIKSFFCRIFPSVKFMIVQRSRDVKATKMTISGVGISDLQELLQHYDIPVEAKVQKKSQGKSDINVLLFEPVKQLSNFIQELNIANIYSLSPGVKVSCDLEEYELNSIVVRLPDYIKNGFFAQPEIQDMLAMLCQVISDDFCSNILQYLRILSSLRKLHERNPIRNVYWEIPPFQGAGTLIMEYFITNGFTRVIGVQARGTFFAGMLIGPYASQNIFNRCHFYITQGATKAEMDTWYPDNLNKAMILPGTMSELDNIPTGLSNIHKYPDVAFYLTGTASSMLTGHISPNVGVQEELLLFLEAQQQKEIHAVVHVNANFENCAMFSVLKTLKHVKMVENTGGESYLLQYSPEVIVMDACMPLLDDIMRTNITIILIRDEMISFNDSVLDELEKRVHYAVNLEQAKQLLKMYFDGKLIKKNNNSYIRKYCNREGVSKKALESFNDI